MKNFVFDSFAMLVFFQKQKDWEKVEQFIVQANRGKVNLSMSLVNYGEVFYTTLREYGSDEAQKVIKIVDILPIKIITPDKEQTIQAATFKADGGISYPDCFAASLTKIHKAKLVTGDKEFKKLDNQIDIEWIEK